MTHMDSFMEYGRIYSVDAPFWSFPGFAIPLVTLSQAANAQYIQRADSEGRVVGFDIYEGGAQVLPLAESCPTAIGDDEIFGIIDPAGIPFVGDRKSLASSVREWMPSVRAPLLRMNFAIFCDDYETAGAAGKEAIEEKLLRFNSRIKTINWFLRSVIMHELLLNIPRWPADETNKIHEWSYDNYPKIHFRRNRSVIVAFPMASLFQGEILFEQRLLLIQKILDIAAIATGYKFHLEDTSSDPTASATTHDLLRKTPDVEAVIDEITRAPRQEQRLAIIINELLNNPDRGERILDIYEDRAQFARRMLSHLRIISPLGLERSEREWAVAREIPFIVSSGYPRRRGQLLLDLAQILKGHPPIARALRQLTERSRSQEVMLLQEQILQALKA